MGKIVAFVPLRGGSKSIPLKNIMLLAGKPLCFWVLDAAVNCPEINEVVISTDNERISEIVKTYPSSKISIFQRSPETATDTASTESAMLEYAKASDFEKMVLIQATSPLLKSEHLSEGLAKMIAVQADSLVSVVRQKRFVWEEKKYGNAQPINYSPKSRPRRQNFDGMLVENGAFYVCSRDGLLKSECRLHGKTTTYEMPEKSYVEIDEPHDWKLIDSILLKEKTKDISEETINCFQRIKLIVLDVDGVLTDAGMYYTEKGDELKKFNTKDGKGIELLKKNGLEVAIITSENTKIVEKRAEKLGIVHLYQGIKNKMEVLNQLVENCRLNLSEVAYVGDDINDLDCIRNVGLSACPSDAMPEIQNHSKIVLSQKGGEGCVRELAEMILKHNN